MKAKYVKNIMNLKEDGDSTDTLAIIGETYDVVTREDGLVYCDVKGVLLCFEEDEVELINPWSKLDKEE